MSEDNLGRQSLPSAPFLMGSSLIQGISGISCLHSILTTEALELEIHITASDSHMDSGASNSVPMPTQKMAFLLILSFWFKAFILQKAHHEILEGLCSLVEGKIKQKQQLQNAKQE